MSILKPLEDGTPMSKHVAFLIIVMNCIKWICWWIYCCKNTRGMNTIQSHKDIWIISNHFTSNQPDVVKTTTIGVLPGQPWDEGWISTCERSRRFLTSASENGRQHDMRLFHSLMGNPRFSNHWVSRTRLIRQADHRRHAYSPCHMIAEAAKPHLCPFRQLNVKH